MRGAIAPKQTSEPIAGRNFDDRLRCELMLTRSWFSASDCRLRDVRVFTKEFRSPRRRMQGGSALNVSCPRTRSISSAVGECRSARSGCARFCSAAKHRAFSGGHVAPARWLPRSRERVTLDLPGLRPLSAAQECCLAPIGGDRVSQLPRIGKRDATVRRADCAATSRLHDDVG